MKILQYPPTLSANTILTEDYKVVVKNKFLSQSFPSRPLHLWSVFLIFWSIHLALCPR